MILPPLMPALSIVSLALAAVESSLAPAQTAQPKIAVGNGSPVAKATLAATLEPTPASFVDATAVFAFADGVV